MTIKYSETFKVENKELPKLREVVEESLKGAEVSSDQIDILCKNVGDLILEIVPELVYIDMSDTYRYEGGFEECTKQALINLKNIGIEKK